MENFKCKYCFFTSEIRIKIAIKSTGRGSDSYPNGYPFWIPDIKAYCGNCNKFIKAAKQTPEMVNFINEYLENLSIKLKTPKPVQEGFPY